MYKLLIVDDEPLIRRGIKKLTNLHEMGISEIFEAENGEQAIEIVETEKPHIVIMDINMPNMDGLTASSIMKEKHPEIFIVILTGYDYFEYAQTAIRAKVDDYILKPISKSDIESVLKKIVAIIVERNKKTEYLQLCNDSHVTEDIVLTDGEDMESIIKNYMVENLFSVELSLSKMAGDIGFNSNYLSGVFKQIYGIPFQNYVNRKRMERAKLLLLTTSMKNYEIAEEIGVEDVNYFITKFKKLWGITPKQYRQGIR